MKKNMKYIYILLSGVALMVFSCVDDYTKSNPPHPFNAPSLQVSSTDENLTIVSLPLNKYKAYVKYGAPVQFTVSVVKARGKIGDITVDSSIDEFATVALDGSTVTQLQGKESGSFTFTLTPSTSLPNTSDRSLNIEIAVSDTQTDHHGESAPLTTTVTIPVTLVGGPCLSDAIIAGAYLVTEASGNLDGGNLYDLNILKENSVDAFSANRVVVDIVQKRPGVYELNEITGGVWPIFYGGRTNPALRVNLCGNVITGRSGFLTTDEDELTSRTFTVNGTVNDDGTITISWSYVRDNSPTPANPAKGTYTMTRIE